ncbi:hypothetical protein LLG95_11885 [bacterium]|nr:hypothetical protein [bacterium]
MNKTLAQSAFLAGHIAAAALMLSSCATPTKTVEISAGKIKIEEKGIQLLWGERSDTITSGTLAASSAVGKETMGVVGGALGGAAIGAALGNPAAGAVVGTIAGGLGQGIGRAKGGDGVTSGTTGK